jgi:hypothetical protein
LWQKAIPIKHQIIKTNIRQEIHPINILTKIVELVKNLGKNYQIQVDTARIATCVVIQYLIASICILLAGQLIGSPGQLGLKPIKIRIKDLINRRR